MPVPNVRFLNSAIFLALLLAVGACDTTGQQDEFAKDAGRAPSGIAQTDAGGTIVSDDKDDWRTAPVFAGKISLRPAYPNPTPVDGFVTLPVTVTAFREIVGPLSIKVVRQGLLYTLDAIDSPGEPGAYIFQFSAALIGARGLHRLYVFDGTGEIVSYGDVEIE